MKKKKKTQKNKNSGSNAITGMNSIRNKIMLLIGGILIFVMIVSGIVVVTSVRSLVQDNEEDISSLATEGLVSEMDIAFEKYISMAQSAANDQSVRNLFSELYTREGFDLNPNFAGAYGTIGSLQNTDSNISMVYAISSRTDVGFDGFDWICDEGFDLTTRAYWFANQEDIDRGFIITEPYLDVASGNMVVGISAPVYDTTGSSIVGVIGIDIQTTNIDSLIVNFDTPYNEENTRTMLFSGNNEVLAAADSSLLLMPAEELGLSSSIVNEIMEPSGKVVSYSDDGKKYYGIVKEDEVSGWKVLLGISKSEFMKYSWMISFKLVAIYLLAVAIMLAVMYSISKQITAPLAKLTTITEELADGRLDTVIDINSNDETGKLAIAMKRLVTRLQEYILYIDEVSENLDRFASGELTMNLKQSYSGEFSKLKVSMNNISERFRNTIGDIVNASQRLAGSSNEIANASHMLAEGASNQASTTEQLTSTIHELSRRVSYNAEHAKNASDQVRSVGERAISGNAQMKEMIIAIEGIEKKSEEISKIIRVIEDISFQTNILALNAAVEAARAGQAGKGFSVVADEVRNLANKSAEAAQDTTVLIGETVESIRVGTALAEEAGIMLNGVIEGVQQTVELINDISQASQDQAVALRETLNGVEQISTVVQTNAATAEESSASSSELSRQAGELSEVVAQFRL